ncbi:MAG: hypothetical protein WDN06_08875 [Asticcacaulis sp.]
MKSPFAVRREFRRDSPLNRGMRNGMAARIVGPWDWIIAPALICAAATIVLAAPIQPFGFYLPEPVLAFALAFAWPLIRPSYIAPVVLGLLGLFLDLTYNTPLGFWTLLLMLTYGALTALRVYVVGQEWIIVFGIYVLAEFAVFTAGVIFMTLDTGAIPRLWGVIEQMFATTLLFPVVLYLLEKYLHADVRFG